MSFPTSCLWPSRRFAPPSRVRSSRGSPSGPGATCSRSRSSGLCDPRHRIRRMGVHPTVVGPGEGHRVGNVEFLARTMDTPRFNFAIIEIEPGRELEAHTHDAEDDAFYIVEGEMTFIFGDEEAAAPPGTFVLV